MIVKSRSNLFLEPIST